MRDQWFGDEGDFVKYALLRKICGITANDGRETLSLGVVWYLQKTKRTDYLNPDRRYEEQDQDLFWTLRDWIRDEGRQGVSLIQTSFLFPDDTVWFRDEVPSPNKTDEREQWLRRAQAKVTERRVVFLDPDKGLQPEDPSGEHVLFDELEAFCGLEGQPTVVVYQHSRRQKWENQVKEQAREIRDRLGLNESSGRAPFGVRHPELNQRFFYVIPSERDRELVQRRIRELRASESPWETLPAFNSG